MKTVDDYMHDPDILMMPEYLREIHAIRRAIQEETRDMTSKEQSAYIHQGALKALAAVGVTPRYADLSGQGKLQAPYKKPVSV
jgi:hypothetical protein